MREFWTYIAGSVMIGLGVAGIYLGTQVENVLLGCICIAVNTTAVVLLVGSLVSSHMN